MAASDGGAKRAQGASKKKQKAPAKTKAAARKPTAKKVAAQASKTPRGWEARVSYTTGPDGFAFVPGEIVTPGDGVVEAVAQRAFPGVTIRYDDVSPIRQQRRLSGVPDVPKLLRELRREGVKAQPNHVFFTHDAGCGCLCPPHPAYSWGLGGGPIGHPAYASALGATPAYASAVSASPAYASPAYASPAYASPAYASPAYASPAYASPAQTTGVRPSSARPAVEPFVTICSERLAAAANGGGGNGVEVVVLDTGLAESAFQSASVAAMLSHLTPGAELDRPDSEPNQALDAAAGHGTFIAGLIQQVAPGTSIRLDRVIHPEGDGDEVQIATAIDDLPDPPEKGAILNLSFGAYVLDEPALMANAVAGAQSRGYVVVASAGNDGTCRPTYPAALPGVVSVGAVGPFGPPLFTNYGGWVRACAPGVDLVSSFFSNWNGDQPSSGNDDPDDFAGWARWSGTSFAAPVVVGALVREMALNGVSAEDAVTRVIDNPALLRIPGLGTVVNVL